MCSRLGLIVRTFLSIVQSGPVDFSSLYRKTNAQRPSKLFFFLAGRSLGGKIFVVVVQSHVAHAVHRLRPFPAAVVDGHVADHVVHDQRRHVLRPVPGARHQSDTESGLVPPTVPRKGLWRFAYEFSWS